MCLRDSKVSATGELYIIVPEGKVTLLKTVERGCKIMKKAVE